MENGTSLLLPVIARTVVLAIGFIAAVAGLLLVSRSSTRRAGVSGDRGSFLCVSSGGESIQLLTMLFHFLLSRLADMTPLCYSGTL